MAVNFYEILRPALLAHPERVVVVWPSATGNCAFTAGALLDRIETLSTDLKARGAAPGTPVLLALPVGMDLVCAMLALMAEGAVPVLPPAGTRLRALPGLLRRTGVRLALTASAAGRAGWALGWLLGVRFVELPAPRPGSGVCAPSVPVPPEQAALVSHSSGSTGRAKAIGRSHAVLTAQHRAISRIFPPWEGQRDFPLFPNVLLHNLAAGVTSILPDVPWADLTRLDPARVLEQMQRENVHTLTGNVFYFTALLAHLRRHPVALPGVRALGIGGSPVPEPLLRDLAAFFPHATRWVIYGSSEAEPIAARAAAAVTPDPLAGYAVGPFHPDLEGRIRPLGVLGCGPWAGQEVGEIEVRGPHVVAADPGDWLRTGDFGYLAGGELYLTGRRGNERLHRGVPHYAVEHRLQHLPGVERVAARADEAGFAVFVQGTASADAVKREFGRYFPADLCRGVYLRASLPVDRRHRSKILYDRLR